MEVEYEITPDDLYSFQWRAATRSRMAKRARRKAYLYLLVSFLVLALLPAIGPDGLDLSRTSFMWIVVAFPVVASIFWLLDRRQTRRAILELLQQEKPGRGQLGAHKISLNETGLLESTVVGESRTSWGGVHRIEEDQDYIYIYTGPIAAHIIPKRAFSSLQEAKSFYHLASASRQAAQTLIT